MAPTGVFGYSSGGAGYAAALPDVNGGLPHDNSCQIGLGTEIRRIATWLPLEALRTAARQASLACPGVYML